MIIKLTQSEVEKIIAEKFKVDEQFAIAYYDFETDTGVRCEVEFEKLPSEMSF